MNKTLETLLKNGASAEDLKKQIDEIAASMKKNNQVVAAARKKTATALVEYAISLDILDPKDAAAEEANIVKGLADFENSLGKTSTKVEEVVDAETLRELAKLLF